MPLAYYSRAATEEFWSEHWGAQEPEGLVRIARRSPLTALIEEALPRSGRILEAGCGLGQYVVLLRERGYGAVGADWSLDALLRCRKWAPAAPVAVADLAALGFKDGAVAAYLSLGVVEHDHDGPDRILREAERVLAAGGRLILSVPYLNGVRRMFRPYLARRQARLRRDGGHFYQYAFTRREVRAFLEAHGFRVLSLTPYDPARILRKAFGRFVRSPHPALSPRGGEGFLNSSPLRGEDKGEGVRVRGKGKDEGEAGTLTRAVRRLLYTPLLLRFLGHMILAVAVKR